MFDILITIAEKDFNKLRFCVNPIDLYVLRFNKIHVVSDIEIPEKYKPERAINYHLDRDVLPIDFELFDNKRKGWYKQQFIKLFQTITDHNYLVIDGDTVLMRPLQVNPNYPCFYHGKNQFHKPYFELMTRLFGVTQANPYSFINEIMLFKRGYVLEMLEKLHLSVFGFIDKVILDVNESREWSGFSEYELYGHWMSLNHPGAYIHRILRTGSKAKKEIWSDEAVEKFIQDSHNMGLDKISLHSWIN
jgi:hypothetical protein